MLKLKCLRCGSLTRFYFEAAWTIDDQTEEEVYCCINCGAYRSLKVTIPHISDKQV